jgi:hypothetical protein
MSLSTLGRMRRRAARATVMLSLSLLSTTLPSTVPLVAAELPPTETLPVEVIYPATPTVPHVDDEVPTDASVIDEGADIPDPHMIEAIPKPDMTGWYGVPIMRERKTEAAVPAVEVLRLAAFDLTPADLAAHGVPALRFDDLHALTNAAIRRKAVPEARLRELVPASPAVAGGYGAMSVPPGSTLTLGVYFDATLGNSRSEADNAWAASVTKFQSTFGIPLNRVSFFLDNLSTIDNVATKCDMQKMALYEMGMANGSSALIIYSDGDVDGNWGVAIDGDVSRNYARGQSNDICNGGLITPAVIPSAYVRDDVGAGDWLEGTASGGGVEGSTSVHTLLSAHEISHVVGMEHAMAKCWSAGGFPPHKHKTLEAMTTGTTRPECGGNKDLDSRYHWEFNISTNYADSTHSYTAVTQEWDRYANCKAAGWCSTNATPSAVRNLTATAQADGSVALSWTRPLSTGSSATLQGNCYYTSTQSNFPPNNGRCMGDVTSAVVPADQIVRGVPNFFYVRAYNYNGSSAEDRDGPRSNIVSATPNLSNNLTNIYFSSLPTTADANQVATVCWTVDGSGPITSTRLHWGTTTAMSNVTPVQTGTASNYFCADITAPSSGTIYVQARASNGTQNLATPMESISVVTGGGSQNDCGTGGDAAGSHASATQIYPPISGCSAQLVSGTDTVDWYTFYVSYSHEATVSITPNGGADFDLCLYDPYGNQAQCSTAGTGATDTIANYDATAGGWWRAQVYIYSGTGSYSLSASVASSSAGPFEIRNDDNEKDIELDLDYSDDIAAKRFSIDPSWKTGRSTATLWIYGRAADCSASGVKWRLRINNNEIAQVNPCDKWSTSGSSWASFSFPFVWALTTQVNTVDFQLISGNDWSTRNVFLAVDTDTNAGTSDMRQNSTWLSGELMWSIVLA